jgi:hypothetical protein
VAPADTSGGPDLLSRLALGTLKLEGTENALTPAQAGELLPLWRMVRGGSLQGDAEMGAVLTQIERKMSGPQLAAVNAMQLEGRDVYAWMQEQGIEVPRNASPALPTGQGGPGTLQNLSEEERAKMREEFQSMSAEQRATRMAEMGVQPPEDREGAGPRGSGQFSAVLDALIELLAERAAE